MKKHKIIMSPPGFGRLPKRFIPEGAQIIGAMTEAGLMGTIYPGGKIYSGLLSEDKTFVIEDAHVNLIKRPALLAALRMGRVHRRLASGTIDYDIKARLVLCTRPFEPSEDVKEIFDIEEWEPCREDLTLVELKRR